jgi:YggT family protein
MLRLICSLLGIYVVAVIARVILSWVGVPRDHPVGRLLSVLARLVDPPLRSIGRVVPAIPLGNVRLDLSPLVLLVGISLVRQIICR